MESVFSQTHLPHSVVVERDAEREGVGPVRTRAAWRATTEWVAFLDDDDRLYDEHLKVLVDAALTMGADVVYPGCDVIGPDGRTIPRRPEWGRFGEKFDPDLLRRKSYIPVTSLVRTSTMRAARAEFVPPAGSQYDDWGFYLKLLKFGARFHHVPKVTWVWNHDGNNTSGLPEGQRS